MIKSLRYTIRQAFVQMSRHKNMCFVSAFSITAMLLILGLFLIFIVNINLIAESAKLQFETLEVYLEENIETNKLKAIEKTLKGLSEVEDVKYISEEDALVILKGRWGDNGYLLEGLEHNSLPASFVIKVKTLEDADSVANIAQDIEGIDEVQYYKTTIDKVLSITNLIQKAGIVAILVLIIISIFIVSNTIKLTVTAREKEISIMKYVGATNWFIRGPFLVEGIIIGLIGAIISLAVIGLSYGRIIKGFSQEAFLIFPIDLVPSQFLIGNLIWIFVSLGVGIGAVGSILSMRRFLDT